MMKRFSVDERIVDNFTGEEYYGRVSGELLDLMNQIAKDCSDLPSRSRLIYERDAYKKLHECYFERTRKLKRLLEKAREVVDDVNGSMAIRMGQSIVYDYDDLLKEIDKVLKNE